MPGTQDVCRSRSAAQREVWYGHRLDPESSVDNAGSYLETDGALRSDLFEAILRPAVTGRARGAGEALHAGGHQRPDAIRPAAGRVEQIEIEPLEAAWRSR